MAKDASNPQAKPLSTFAIFMLRMKHEGREDECRDKLKQIQADTGKRFTAAMWQLLKESPEFGYVDSKTEQAWYDTHKAELLMDEKKAKKAAASRKSRAKKAEQEQAVAEKSEEEKFVAAISQLPTTAPYDLEFDWIRSHPAIIRMCLTENINKKIRLTVDDVINPPNGKAPSQAAVYQLINAANAPAKMMSAVFDKMKKAMAEAGGRGGPTGNDAPGEWDDSDDEGIAETEALLQRLKEQVSG